MQASSDETPEPVGLIWHQYRIPMLLGGISILCILFSIVLLIKSSQNVTPIKFSSVSGETSESARIYQNITVDIEGAVKNPGVYEIPVGSRVEDAIGMAGGTSTEADEIFLSKSINRAQKLVDGMKLYIPKEGEILSRSANTSHIISVQSDDGGAVGAYLVSINSSSQSELESLPGVGPVTATAIIASRPYNSIEDLLAKKVVGASLFEKIKNSLSL